MHKTVAHQNKVTEFLHLHTRLERELELATLDDNIGEIQQMDFERVQHSFTGDNNLFGLFFNW